MSEMNGFVIKDGRLVKAIEPGLKVIIPDGVSSIGEGAFRGCNRTVSVVISDGVKSIEEEAFENCTRLKRVTMPESVMKIGNCAFYGCSNLTEAVIPKSVTSIGVSAFNHCSRLMNAIIPDGVKSIEKGVFSDCSSLTNVMIPDSVACIEYAAFAGCRSLTSVGIPDNVTSIEDNAFASCSSLKSVKIPMSVTSIGDNAFYACSELTSVSLPATLKRTGKDVFKNCNKALVINVQGDKDKMKSAAFSLLLLKFEVIIDGNRMTPDQTLRMITSLGTKEKKISKASSLEIVEYIKTHAKELSIETIEEVSSWFKRTKNDSAADLIGKIPEVKMLLPADHTEEHPIEAVVQKKIKGMRPDQKIVSSIKEGIHYAEGNGYCSCEALIYLIWQYAKKMEYDSHGLPNLNSRSMIMPDPDADRVANALDRIELSTLLTRLIKSSYGLYLLPWARYATDDRIHEMTDGHIMMSRGKPKCDNKGSNLYEALLLSETRTAMQMFERFGDLDRYAQRHNMTAMELRDSMMLPAFDFDADGVKRYDIGGDTIEVSIAPDLSFRLFDVNKQKDIRSFPKKSDDPAKAEACAKEYATFKKEVLAFAKERTELLHKMHMSGEYVRADLWQKVYVEHPVISKLARLVAWQDETGKTFMIADDGIIDSQSSAYATQGKIRVAHVLDMDDSDIAAWQQWLAKRGCVQLFEQVWEPVILWNKDGIATRYTGAILTNEERNAVKRALKLRGVDMRAAEMDKEYNHRAGEWVFSNEGTMLFGDCLRVDYTVDENTKAITFGKASSRADTGNREMNATLLEMDKATLSVQITRDNDAALTDRALSVFSAAQIAGLLNLAIDHKATRCTARLLDYKNTHFPEFAEVNEFSLDW